MLFGIVVCIVLVVCCLVLSFVVYVVSLFSEVPIATCFWFELFVGDLWLLLTMFCLLVECLQWYCVNSVVFSLNEFEFSLLF